MDGSGAPLATGHDDLSGLIGAHLQAHPERISRLATEGQFIWVKRPERPSGIRRLQKGNPATAFERERNALHTLHRQGVPVPGIVSEGPGYLAIRDCGMSLDNILRSRDFGTRDRARIFSKAGHALADMHARHLSHGRPSLRDICWDGRRIAFLDFERHAEHRNTRKGHVNDLLMFVFNAFAIAATERPEILSAISAYRAADSARIWDDAVNWCQRWRWITWATAPVRALRDSREFNAIPLTFNAFLDFA